MGTAVERYGTDRRAGIHPEERRFAVNLGAHEQMILRGTNERERDILEAARLQRSRPRAGQRGQTERSAQQESESFASGKERNMGKHGREDSTPA